MNMLLHPLLAAPCPGAQSASAPQGAGAATAVLGLPDLPANARYVVHEDSGGCFDWGAYAWALAEVEDPRQYKYLMFLNSSVRGPYLPAYWPVRCLQQAFEGNANHDSAGARRLCTNIDICSPCAGHQALDNSLYQ